MFKFFISMKVNPVNYSYCKYTSFKGNKISTIVEKLSMRDFHTHPDSSEFRELRKIYNNLYKKLALPENLKPRLQYKAMIAEMSFSLSKYIINVDKRLSPFKMNVRNKTGYNEAKLRHEIEHLKQFWDIVRLWGADRAAELLEVHRICEVKPGLYKKLKEIEQTLGRISPISKEGKNAQLYVDAMVNYPEVKNYYGGYSLEELIIMIQYRTNLLEKKARITEKEYKPSLSKTIKISFQEFIKLIKSN